MTDTPKCDICGREMERNGKLSTALGIPFSCPATPDQHRIAELESKLAAAEVREWELRQKLFRSDCNAMGEGWGHTLCAEQRDAAEAQVKELESKLAAAEVELGKVKDSRATMALQNASLLTDLDQVILDRDAAEAQVESLKLETKALTEERDHLIKLSHRLRSDLMAYGKHLFTCSAIKERLGECNCGLRAALKMGGE